MNSDKWDVEPSKRKNKKYDVYHNDKYILSFGDKRYQHYFDKFGYYSNLNHLNKKRRDSYKKRAEGIGNLNNPYSSNFWSYWGLW